MLSAGGDLPGTPQVQYEDKRRSSASPRPPCDGTPSASVWPSPRQTPGPPFLIHQIGLHLSVTQADARPAIPYPSDRYSLDATTTSPLKNVSCPCPDI